MKMQRLQKCRAHTYFCNGHQLNNSLELEFGCKNEFSTLLNNDVNFWLLVWYLDSCIVKTQGFGTMFMIL